MSKGLDIDIAIEELLAQQQNPAPTYPDDHRAGMKVPKGGSSCASCEYLADNRKDCTNKYFQKWNGSEVIPAPIDEYCSDWYEHDDDLEAYGTSEGAEKGWDTRGRGRHEAEGELETAVKTWQLSPHLIKKFAKSIVTGEKFSTELPPSEKATWKRWAQDLLDGIRNGDEVHQMIYRGLRYGTPQEATKYTNLKAGDEFQLPAPHSFSTNFGTARGFAIGTLPPDKETRIVFALNGAKGIDVVKVNPDSSRSGYAGEDEVITNGRFKVVGASDHKMYDGGHFRQIDIEQLGTL